MEPPVSIDNLTPSEACRLRELLEAIRAPVEEWVAPDSDLLGRVEAEEFRSRLLTQHLFLGSPLFQDTFDRALAESISVGQEPPHLIVKIDRSDAKITLNAIRKDVCFVHATWQLAGFARGRS